MKLTGRQLFEKNKHAFEDLTLESNDESKASEEVKDEQQEVVEEEEEEAFVYDRALYEGADAADLEEDVDFD